jgi:hypothetical protein
MAGLTISPIVLGFAVIFALAKADLSKFAWGDFLMLGLFVMVLAWLSLPTRDQTPGHKQARQDFAFRLGKSLHRVWRGNGR